MAVRLTDAAYAERLQRVAQAVATDLAQAAERGAQGELPDWAVVVVTTGHRRLSAALDPNTSEGG